METSFQWRSSTQSTGLPVASAGSHVISSKSDAGSRFESGIIPGGGSGVLLYVLLFEHMGAVIADRSILDKLGQEQIDELCNELTQRLHEGTVIDALCVTATSLGRRLAPLLPRAEDDVNELPDALVVIE